jgi:hypothetical protein
MKLLVSRGSVPLTRYCSTEVEFVMAIPDLYLIYYLHTVTNCHNDSDSMAIEKSVIFVDLWRA